MATLRQKITITVNCRHIFDEEHTVKARCTRFPILLWGLLRKRFQSNLRHNSMSKAVVQIFFSEEQKKKAAAASKNKTNVRIGPLRKAVPSTKIQGTRQSKAKKQPNPKTTKGKVVKSAVRPIQKLAKTVKIIQPKKGAPMQPKVDQLIMQLLPCSRQSHELLDLRSLL